MKGEKGRLLPSLTDIFSDGILKPLLMTFSVIVILKDWRRRLERVNERQTKFITGT
jgi:hypothetical protein